MSQARPAGVVRLFLAGDVMLGRGVDQILPHPSDPVLHERWMSSALGYLELAEQASGPIPRPVGFDYVWGDALEIWRERKPDLRLVNLETAVTRSDRAAPKGINYRMSPANAACLTAGGIDGCTLANNHVLDWGRTGLLETRDTLARLGLRIAGAGRDLDAARAPAVFDLGEGGRLLFYAFCTRSSGVPSDWAATPVQPGVNLIELTPQAAAEAAERTARARRPGDLVVASVHWGPNWGWEVPQAQRDFAHALIEAGVSVVHGHSSHHAKGIEVHREGLILYGAGDFLNDYEGIAGHEAYRGDLAVMWFADLDRKTGALAGLELVPLRIRRMRLNRAKAADIRWLQHEIAAHSPDQVALTLTDSGALRLT
ncbi:CapA family protein [Caulobacter sp. 17J80-11]|uniref:CapA family protein n=1 Tax=Caulobacter sp. 17J80-11 TaxID=2763502 RepID=UPI00165364B7|nr:CapA family protein [Caulobacter sp. 17J80-11]MBC6982987.1 CapA family protein [Caulobacter sp. 17J80-11]